METQDGTFEMGSTGRIRLHHTEGHWGKALWASLSLPAPETGGSIRDPEGPYGKSLRLYRVGGLNCNCLTLRL